ncbi:MAG: SPOR domain-containing protein [Bacillota bacterium]
MSIDRPKLKSGFSLAAMVVSMSILAAVIGYFLGNWMIQYVTAPEDQIENVTSEKVVSEEKINTSDLNKQETNNNSSSSSNSSETIQKNEESNSSTSQPQVKEDSASDLFVVQVGAFSKQSNAKKLVEKLKSEGYSAYVTSKQPYKVQVGAYKKQTKAEELSKNLKEDGYSVFIAH